MAAVSGDRFSSEGSLSVYTESKTPSSPEKEGFFVFFGTKRFQVFPELLIDPKAETLVVQLRDKDVCLSGKTEFTMEDEDGDFGGSLEVGRLTRLLTMKVAVRIIVEQEYSADNGYFHMRIARAFCSHLSSEFPLLKTIPTEVFFSNCSKKLMWVVPPTDLETIIGSGHF